jgi:hypothetical protein
MGVGCVGLGVTYLNMEEIKELLLSGDHSKVSEAIVLLQDVSDQYIWLRDYANARLLLPTGFKSWTQVYGESMRKGLGGPMIQAKMNIPMEDANENHYVMVERFTISISELHRNVANEVLFFQTFMDYGRLSNAIRQVENGDLQRRMARSEFDSFMKATSMLMNLIHAGRP